MYRQKNAGRPPAAHAVGGCPDGGASPSARPALASHVNAVCELACAVAEELGLTGADLEALRHAAALHDIGKMAIPESILEKPGALSDTSGR